MTVTRGPQEDRKTITMPGQSQITNNKPLLYKCYFTIFLKIYYLTYPVFSIDYSNNKKLIELFGWVVSQTEQRMHNFSFS